MRQSTVQSRAELYREAMRVIELRHTDQKLSLATVAREIGTSRRQLQRAFAETGGTSFRRELDRARMSRAAQLLSDGSQSVKKVGAAVGYRYAAQFAKAFRRHHGRPPSDYRGEHSLAA